MSISALRNASTSALSTGKHRVVVVGAGSGGLAVANQLWNAARAEGRGWGEGDVAVVDVSHERRAKRNERGGCRERGAANREEKRAIVETNEEE
jgi:malic enzyme